MNTKANDEEGGNRYNTIINKNNISEASETTKQGTNDKGERKESIKELFIVLSWVFHIYNGMLK